MNDKVFTLVTSATSTMGSDFSEKIVNKKNIILHGRDAVKLKELKKSLEKDNEKEVLIWICDFVEVEDVKISLVTFIKKNKVVINEFIHFSGRILIKKTKRTTLQEAQDIFNITFFSCLEVIKVLLSKTNKSSLKNIILVSALSSKFGEKANALYVSSKSALEGLVKSLALELAPTIRVNSVLPGGIKTNMTNMIPENSPLLKDNLLGVGLCEDISNYLLFLLSDKSKWITGQSLIIDGGRSIDIFKV